MGSTIEELHEALTACRADRDGVGIVGDWVARFDPRLLTVDLALWLEPPGPNRRYLQTTIDVSREWPGWCLAELHRELTADPPNPSIRQGQNPSPAGDPFDLG